MNRREIERRLRALARSAVPGPRDEFVDELRGRLRATGLPPRKRRPMLLRPGLALAAAAIAAVIVAGVLVGTPTDDRLTLTNATDAVVVLPDGRVVSHPQGLALPDGAVVRTGTSGSVRAGNDELGPNREARVREGRLVNERPYATPARPTQHTTPPPVARPTPTEQPTRPPASRPPSPTTTTHQDLALACRPADGGIACRWSSTDHPMFAAYVLVRDDTNGRRTVFRTTDRTQTSFVDRQVARGAGYTYTVDARDARGNVLARGGPARV
ncbi:MAG: hypothetical protein L0206_12895 [Actinobacteria bacterium]|nr:hypothetical protein [Actinomycetota bacterium]